MSKWLSAWKYCQENPGVPALLKDYAFKRASRILNKRAKPATRPPIRFPKGKDPRKDKKDLRAECEALCKALVFHRDCGHWEERYGKCITCPAVTTLQWGHFLPRQGNPALYYSVQNTGGQCGTCNGPRGGNQLVYARAIDERSGAGAAAMLEKCSEENKNWRWNKTTLTKERRLLAALCGREGIDVSAVLAKLNNKGETE